MNASPLRKEPDASAASSGEALSAWIDGELDEGEARRLLDRLKTDGVLCEQFESMHWVGDALRSHEVAASQLPGLAQRISLALESEPALLAPRAMALTSQLRRHAASGLTLAAAAAVLAVVALPQLRGSPAPAPVAAEQVATVAPKAGPAVPRVAPTADALATLPRSSQLDAYFRAHREMASQGVMPEAVAYIRSGGEPDR